MTNTQLKPTLFGYGLTTKAIAKRLGGGCLFYDDKVKEPYTDEMGNKILPSSLFDPDKSELEVTTPSLKPDHPLIQKAKHLLSEYDYILASRHLELDSRHPELAPKGISCGHSVSPSSEKHKPFTIWISGTNGKTTTTQMLTHLLEKRGAVSGGNIGTPLAELPEDAPIWVLETSSFTLHHTHIASPDIYLLLPITPDHLDWHGTPEAYEADKLKPLLTMKEGELALVPKGLKLPKTEAYVVTYDSNKSLCDYFNLDASNLHYAGAFLQDALLSLSVTRVLFDETDYTLINQFKRDAHRQEEIYDSKGRLWINDSKATNLDATIQAVKTYAGQRHLHLILGGEDKGVDLSPLFEILKPLSLTLYSIGANSEKIKILSRQYKIDLQESGTLQNAIMDIDKVHTNKSIALLSPAAASFDQFQSYKERGDTFKKEILSTKKNNHLVP